MPVPIHKLKSHNQNSWYTVNFDVQTFYSSQNLYLYLKSLLKPKILL